MFLNPKAYYIFLGDYIDRGTQNAKVVQFLLGIMDLPNVCLLEGNHERWLYKWGKEKLDINEFSTFTLKDLENGGITSKDTHRLYAKLRQCAYYTYDEKSSYARTEGFLRCQITSCLWLQSSLFMGVADMKICKSAQKA